MNSHRSKFAMKKVALCIIWLLTCLFSACVNQRGSVIKNWGSASTPGVTLRLHEVNRQKEDGFTTIEYRLSDSGFPPGKTYNFWRRKIGEPPKILHTGLILTESGKLASKSNRGEPPLLLEKTKFRVHDFARGEPLEVAVVSDDGRVKAFSKAIPFPIEARGEGRCRLWVELGVPLGQAFVIQGEGFEPHEKVKVVSKSEEETIESNDDISADGRFLVVMAPAVKGKDSGVATYTASGKRCKLTVNYQWGRPALRSQ